MAIPTYSARDLALDDDRMDTVPGGSGDVYPGPHRDDEMAFPGGGDQGMEYEPPNPAGAAYLVSGPGQTPSAGVRGPNTMPSTRQGVQPGKSAPAPSTSSYQGMTEQGVQAFRDHLRQQPEFAQMPDDEFERYVQYGVAKQRGRIAAQNKKILSGPLGKYFSLLQKEAVARSHVEAENERYKSKKAEFGGGLDPGWLPYQDRINAGIKRAEGVTKRRQEMQKVLEGMGIKPEYLANPVTVMEFMRNLAAGDPSTADEIGPDDLDDEDFGLLMESPAP